MTVDSILTLLHLPSVQVVFSLLISAVVGYIVRAQVTRLGVDNVPLPGLSAWRWSSLAGSLAFWLSALLLLQLSLGRANATEAVILMLSRIALAGVSLLLASWLAHARVVAAEELDRSERQRAEADRWPIMAAGAAAAVLALAGGSTVLLLLCALGLLGLLLLSDSGPSRALAGLLANLGAGVELRARVKLGQVVSIDGVEHTIKQRPGLLVTWSDRGPEGRQAHDNSRILAALPPDSLELEDLERKDRG